jgi:hypothetical protein
MNAARIATFCVIAIVVTIGVSRAQDEGPGGTGRLSMATGVGFVRLLRIADSFSPERLSSICSVTSRAASAERLPLPTRR